MEEGVKDATVDRVHFSVEKKLRMVSKSCSNFGDGSMLKKLLTFHTSKKIMWYYYRLSLCCL